jgi:hypothetical protein
MDLGGQDLTLEIPPLPLASPVASEVGKEPVAEELKGQLAEGVPPSETSSGHGIDAATVTEDRPAVLEDGLPPTPAVEAAPITGPITVSPVGESVGETPDGAPSGSTLDDGIPPEPVVEESQLESSTGAVGLEQPGVAQSELVDDGIPQLPDLSQPMIIPEATGPSDEEDPANPATQPPALPEAQTEPTTMPEQPIASPGRPDATPPTNGTGAKEEIPATGKPEAKPVNEPRKVGAPGVTVSGPVTTVSGSPQTDPLQEAEKILTRPKEVLSQAEAQEIMGRIRQRDLDKLDREIDKLYEKVVELMSGEDEARVAFDALRKARQMLLLEPEQVAEVEYLVNRIRSMLTRVEQSATWGPYYGPRILAYQVVWLALLGVFALVTTVPGTGFARWIAYWIGVEQASATVNLITLLLSTLAWGGIGGVTGALWSLHYHVSILRDFDKAENLWYIEQPILGMVLGGIVYLIMAAGFLVVQVDLTTPEAALGAKLLPAAVAVVAGFRQNLVLDLVDRVVSLLAPNKGQETKADSSTGTMI